MRICASLYNIYYALSDHPNGGAKLQLIFELTKKKCKKVYPMDCFLIQRIICPGPVILLILRGRGVILFL